MPTAVKNLSASLLCLLALSSLALAQSFDEEVKYYLNSGETHLSAEVTVEGKAYRVVKVNNLESFIFDAQLAMVREEAVQRKVIEAYVQLQYSQQPAINVQGIKDQYLALNRSVGGSCMVGVDRFFLFSGPGSAYFFIQVQCSVKPRQCGALGSLNKSAIAVRSSLAELNSSVNLLEAAVAAKSVDDIYARLSVANKATAALQSNYSSLSAAYKLIAEGDANEPGYLYAFGGANFSCNVTTQISTAFTQMLSLTSVAKPDSLDKTKLYASISAATNARYEPAQVRKVYEANVKIYNEAKNSSDRLASSYAALGVTLSFLASRDAALRAKLAAVANTSTQAKAEEAAKTFETERSALNAQVTLYQSLLVEFRSAKDAEKNVSTQVSLAATKYGTTDARVQSLQQEQANFTAKIRLLEGDLKDGKTVEASRIQALTTEGRALALKAAELKPLEAQFDLVLIGGVVVVILVIVGVVWYARKRKRESEGLGAY